MLNFQSSFTKHVLTGLFIVLPMGASASYVCTCYTDNRPVGQGLYYQGQVDSGSISAGQYHCKTAYGATIAKCSEVSDGSSYSNSSAISPDLTSLAPRDCIKAPVGIADACLEAFQPEYNPNPGQTELIRESCIRTAISARLVKSCLKKFPLHSTQDEKATYKRSACIDEASVGQDRIAFRCSM